ncbi:hypothetical protein PZA11_007023 [Diplocarpon coronariae]
MKLSIFVGLAQALAISAEWCGYNKYDLKKGDYCTEIQGIKTPYCCIPSTEHQSDFFPNWRDCIPASQESGFDVTAECAGPGSTAMCC